MSTKAKRDFWTKDKCKNEKLILQLYRECGNWHNFMKAWPKHPVFKGKTRSAIETKIKRLGMQRDGNYINDRNWVEKMEKENPDQFTQFNADIRNGNLSHADIANKYGLTRLQVSNHINHSNLTEQRKQSRASTPKPGDYENRIAQLISQGALVDDKKGISFIIKTLKDEFPNKEDINPKSLANLIEDAVWSKVTLEHLAGTVRFDSPLEKFHQYNRHIPMSMIKAKAKELTGSSSIKRPPTFSKGMGRLDFDYREGDEHFEIKSTSMAKPYEFAITTPSWQVPVINGANIGSIHNRVLAENHIVKALEKAEQNGAAAVILTNPIDIEFKKAAGPVAVYRAVVSGRNTNLEILDPSYQPRAKRILETKSKDETLYETAAETFLNILSGWEKIARDSKIPKLIIFGYKEEELIATAAYLELSYKTKLRQAQLEAEIKMAERALANAEGEERKLFIQKLEDLVKEKSRTIISNIRPEDFKIACRRVLANVVRKFEESIPNSKVIGQGSTFIKFSDQTVLFQMVGHQRITDTLLEDFTKSYGPRVLLGSMPPTVVVCSQYSLNLRYTVREGFKSEGSIIKKRTCYQVFVAPIAVDGNLLRNELQRTSRKVHPLSKLVFAGQFRPGILTLRYGNGLISHDDTPISMFLRKKASQSKEAYLWIMTGTDQHWGSRSKEFVWNNKTREHLGVCEAVIEMMRRSKLLEGDRCPIHIFNVNDDPTQGNHFGTHLQPDPREMGNTEMMNYLRDQFFKASRSRDLKKVLSIFDDTAESVMRQFYIRGLDFLEHQILEMCDRHIQANLDFFEAIIRRNLKSGLVWHSYREIRGHKVDSRDLGCINMGTGNHFTNTVERALTEGFIYAREIINSLKGKPEWAPQEALLKKLIRSPKYGETTIGWGTVQIPGGYEYGLSVNSSPARLSSWGDPLLAVVRNDQQRGDFTAIGVDNEGANRLIVKLYGDKHFFTSVSTEHSYYHMSAAATSTDRYGEHGFPHNNTGISILGVPAEGPRSGPILLRVLPFDRILRYFEKDEQDFDWEASFLPNPV
ncbi:hypothetical protein KW791_02965 [Candidatus Parcubacteria bacterium]|nr:hypothetical protein [Candidatus Parcubacteria bacterium]